MQTMWKKTFAVLSFLLSVQGFLKDNSVLKRTNSCVPSQSEVLMKFCPLNDFRSKESRKSYFFESVIPPLKRPTLCRSDYAHQGVWLMEQPLIFAGYDVKIRMQIFRLEDGRIVMVSPIAPTQECIDQLTSTVGVPTDVIAVNGNPDHSGFIDSWKRRFPSIRIWAVKSARAVIRSQISGFINDGLPKELSSDFESATIVGKFGYTEAVIYHRSSKSIAVGDSCASFSDQYILENSRFPEMTRLMLSNFDISKNPILEESKFGSAFFQRVNGWDFQNCFAAHGDWVMPKPVVLSKLEYLNK